MAFKLEDRSFRVAEIERQLDLLRRPDTVLIDTATLPMYGPQLPGRRVELNNRSVEIAGQFVLGTGFVGLGSVVTSDLNFTRIFPDRSRKEVSLGLVMLQPGSDAAKVAARLRQILPADVTALTRAELADREEAFWRVHTSTGLVFGFGVAVSIIVGGVILYQALATQVTRQLPQYATLKAIGYSDFRLQTIVLTLALLTAVSAFSLAWVAALLTYAKVRTMARLPIEMTALRVALVFATTIGMSAASALLAFRKIRRADPADLF